MELKLADFGVEAQVVAVHPGPVITRYELQPAAGVKVSQITNLAKDLARALSAISVRVVEVIPGKSTVGLEIPNEEREVVQLLDTLKSEAFENAKSPLTLALGKDISGTPVVADLAKMPPTPYTRESFEIGSKTCAQVCDEVVVLPGRHHGFPVRGAGHHRHHAGLLLQTFRG